MRVASRATLKRKAKEMADQTRRQGSRDVGTIAAARDTAATFHKWAREHDQDAALHNGDTGIGGINASAALTKKLRQRALWRCWSADS